MNKLAIIILAAGCSARLGQPKQLIPMYDRSLLAFQCQQALKVHGDISCVLGFKAEIMANEIDSLPVKLVINSSWQQGLSSSISMGVTSLPADIDGVMLVLVDQWRLIADDLQQLISIWQKQPDRIIAAGGCSVDENIIGQLARTKKEISKQIPNKILGPPVIFPRRFFRQLAGEHSGNGAKKLLKEYSKQVIEVELPHAFVDLDTPKQLAQLQEYLATKSTINLN